MDRRTEREQAEMRAEFEKWCPIKIIDEAPKSYALVSAYWTAWQAAYRCARGVRARPAPPKEGE
jgi:hypothetical protein